MENGEKPKLTLDEQFDQLPIGGLIKLPISMVHPTDVDSGFSTTDGPSEIYREDSSGKIFIYDGNKRYFLNEKKLSKEFGFENIDKYPVEFKKVKNDKPW